MKILKIVGYGIIAIILFCIGLYNFKNNSKFFEASVTTLISIIIAVVFSYFLVQKRNDVRKKNEKIDNVILKIEGIILSENFIKATNEGVVRKNLILQRSVANKIKYLETVIPKECAGILKKISEIFFQFREFYGEHYTDKSYMTKSEKTLINFICMIDDLCDQIHITLL